MKLPPLKMYFCGTNPFHRHQQISRIIEGWREAVIAAVPVDLNLPLPISYLPAATQFERNDLVVATAPIVASSPRRVRTAAVQARNI